MLGVCILEYNLHQVTVRTVIVALFFLFFYNFTLCFNTRTVDFGMQHTLSFHPQGQLFLVRRHGLEVISTVLRGVCVQHTTIGLDHFKVFTTTDIVGTFKHKVLKEVRETGTFRIFVFRTHVVHYGYVYNWCRVVFM
ncbi:hypothetical protein D3C80_1374410 [compost metagenome]